MRLLLDTHEWLWTLTEPHRIRKETLSQLARPDVTLYLSAANAWEIAIKHHLGELLLPEHPRDFVSRRLIRDLVIALPVEHRHAVEVAGLPDHHQASRAGADGAKEPESRVIDGVAEVTGGRGQGGASIAQG